MKTYEKEIIEITEEELKMYEKMAEDDLYLFSIPDEPDQY